MKTMILPVVLLAGLATAGGAAEDIVRIPDGVRYEKASPEVNAKAKGLIQKGFAAKPYKLDSLFGSHVICGPNLWASLQTRDGMKQMKVAPVIVRIPLTGGRVQQLQGAVFQTQEEVATFSRGMQDYLASEDKYVVRRPTEGELRLFWAMISYDITEPLFVVANANHAVLMHFTDEMKVLWIDDLHGMHLEE